jgi:hypothetical protein
MAKKEHFQECKNESLQWRNALSISIIDDRDKTSDVYANVYRQIPSFLCVGKHVVLHVGLVLSLIMSASLQ